MSDPKTPVVFVHGLWLHTSSWEPWLQRFTEAGYEPHNPGWPGDQPTVEEARAHPDSAAGFGIDEVVAHYADYLATLSAPAVVVGHSFGGLIAERLLTESHAAACVSIDAAPIKGVINLPPSALKVASIALKNPKNFHGSVALTPDEFRYGFANALTEDEGAELFEHWTIPSPGRPLFEAAVANFVPHSAAKADTKEAERGPLLLIAGGMDHTVPASITKTALKLFGKSPAVTDFHEFDDRGHSLTIDHGWSEVADVALTWLKAQKLAA
jgi:pimeloyl-ACP methyl ester carboxylesterase